MADAKRKTYPVHVTPIGVGQYTWVNTPDTKFDKDGVYKTNLILDAEANDAPCKDKKGNEAGTLAEIIASAQEQAEAEATSKLASAKKEGKAKGKKITAYDLPVEDELDDDEDPTGAVIYKFKMRASGTRQDGTRWKRSPNLVDAKGQPVKSHIFSGSTMRVAFTATPWVNPKFEYGVKLALEAVRVLELVSGSGNAAAAFGDEEDGYDAADDNAALADQVDEDDDEDDDDVAEDGERSDDADF